MTALSTSIGILLACLACAQAAAQDLVITNARIIDGNGGVIDNGTVMIADGRIASVSESAPAGGGALDAGGMTVMPGFIDAHRHIMDGDPDRWLREQADERMREFLEGGFTTVLSAGDPLEQILELRERLDEGDIEGPRLIAAGRVPLARGGPQRPPGVDPARSDASRAPRTAPAEAIPEEETRSAVRALAEAGVDAIKNVITVTPGGPEKKTLMTVVDEAHRHGIPVITHAVTVEDTLAAVEAGVDVLVHTPHIGQLTEAQAERIASAGIPMMSTLGVFVPAFAEDNARIRERTGRDNVARFRDLEPYPMSHLPSAGQGPVNARMLWDAGIVYGYGTDTRFLPRDSLAHELRPLRLVFSAADIVAMMTRNAAETVGLAGEIGTLETGKIADLVLIDGNPLADIHDVLKVAVVIKGGRIVVDNR
ncbi:MAG: amidohydrolase family protein [Gammaproteobacteria bacterium]|nr:amidohydrolase family protein [Gammaproteobacteria bacterium]